MENCHSIQLFLKYGRLVWRLKNLKPIKTSEFQVQLCRYKQHIKRYSKAKFELIVTKLQIALNGYALTLIWSPKTFTLFQITLSEILKQKLQTPISCNFTWQRINCSDPQKVYVPCDVKTFSNNVPANDTDKYILHKINTIKNTQ